MTIFLTILCLAAILAACATGLYFSNQVARGDKPRYNLEMVLIELILNAYYGVVAGALMAWTHIPLWGGWSTGVALTATVLYAVVMLVASMTGDIACSQTLAKVISMFHVARFVAVAVPFIYVVCIR